MGQTRVHPAFYRQSGYGAFAVGASNEEKVSAHVPNRDEHHREMKFEDELRGLLTRHRTHTISWANGRSPRRVVRRGFVHNILP